MASQFYLFLTLCFMPSLDFFHYEFSLVCIRTKGKARGSIHRYEFYSSWSRFSFNLNKVTSWCSFWWKVENSQHFPAAAQTPAKQNNLTNTCLILRLMLQLQQSGLSMLSISTSCLCESQKPAQKYSLRFRLF